MAVSALAAAFRAASRASRSAAARKLFRAAGFRVIAQTSGRQAARLARIRAINTGVRSSRAVGAGSFSAGAAGIGAAVGIPIAVNQYRKANMGKRPGPAWPQDDPGNKRYKPSADVIGSNLRYYKRREGRRPRPLSKILRMAKGSEKYVIHRFANIGAMSSDAGANRGTTALCSFVRTADGAGTQAFPVHLFNLTCYPQSFVSGETFISTTNGDSAKNPPVMWGLRGTVPVVNAGMRIGYFETPGVNTASAQINQLNNPVNNRWALQYNKDVEITNPGTNAQSPAIGRTGYLDWAAIRLLFYGKKNYDTKINVSLIKFTRDEYTPDWNWRGGYANSTLEAGIQEELDEKWKTVLHPLINNPIATRESRRRAPFVVLENHPITIPSKDSSDVNADPEQVVFNLFKRFNKVIDFSRENRPTGVGVDETVTDFQNENDPGLSTSIEMGEHPKRVRDNIYLMISAWDPLNPVTEVSLTLPEVVNFRNTYDFNISRRYTGGTEVFGR